MRLLLAALLGLILFAPVARAEDAAPAAAAATTPAPAADDAGLERRLALATRMQSLNPAEDQVNAAIDQIAGGQPPGQQESFRTTMRSILNYKAIEKISIDAMADIYTEAELQAMVDYYSKPEAKSAAAKQDEYMKKVGPEITRMLDQAMMKIRTGQ